ncbi:MAG: SdrD B-like domain-containing protein, partial [Chitinophagaceae bacterium]
NIRIYDGSLSSNTTYAKGGSLGDIEYLSEIAPIEVGNRVWNDTDGDGIQDPGENPIAGVTVQLLNSGGTVIATATTDANGNYYFSSASGTSTASAIYGVSGLTYNSNYCIRIPNVQGGSKQAALGTNTLTTANADNSDGDIRDSDGTLSGNNAEVCFTTGSAGENNHTYDFGFTPAPVCVKPNAGSDAVVCATECYNLTGTAPTTGSWTAMAGNPAGATLGTTTAGVAQVCFTASATGAYNFIYTVTGGCTDTVALTVNPQATVGNYVWNDLNNNGLQDEAASAGINGVTVELWNATTNTLVSSTTTANNGGNPGYYEFKTCTAGSYYVKFPTTNSGNGLTTQTVTAATDGNSDASTTTGQSPAFTLDPNGTAIQRNNPTIDAGYGCAAPAAPTCAPITICTGVDATAAVTAAVAPAGGTIVW